jgi:hypothetical protein
MLSILCLTLTFQLYSQKLSSDTENCIVPCKSLRAALTYKSGAEMKIEMLKDSVKVLKEIVSTQDSAIDVKTEKIKTLSDNVSIMKEKEVEHLKALDTYKDLYADEKKKKKIAYGITGVTVLLSILLLL